MGKNEENQENKEESTVILKAFIHCEGCSNQISNCLRGLDGVKQVHIDREHQRVSVRGVVNDPVKVLERLQKKYSKNVELISPKPKPDNKQKKPPEKKEQAKVKTMVLKMYFHCDGCETVVKRKIQRMEGIESVDVDREKSQVVVKGTVEAKKLVEDVKRKLGKHVEIMKEDNKKEPKKEGKDDEKGKEPVIMYSYPPQYSTNYLYPNQTFSDENVFACSIM
ncbi:heavy metal-associated isoprenylated plant protein 8-like [Cajanus cajan]|uniref:heavy metal-associated isoprenylated plant protein 8-like n=1 Tax=Cajanus cajan TaxID=3821 RepID=UPI00098D7E1A|nr:heavy metal-associated isoprenylated plant protein 8-like [Cajanus cajan]